MSKNLTENYPIVDTVEALEERLAGVREAQRIFAAYTQEQVDKIFTVAALAANKARIPLAKLAVEETGMGIVEDKVIKNHMPLNTFIMLTEILRRVVLLKRIRHMELKRLLNLLELLQP